MLTLYFLVLGRHWIYGLSQFLYCCLGSHGSTVSVPVPRFQFLGSSSYFLMPGFQNKVLGDNLYIFWLVLVRFHFGSKSNRKLSEPKLIGTKTAQNVWYRNSKVPVFFMLGQTLAFSPIANRQKRLWLDFVAVSCRYVLALSPISWMIRYRQPDLPWRDQSGYIINNTACYSHLTNLQIWG